MARLHALSRITVAEAVDAYLDLARTQLEVGQLQPATVETYARDMHEFLRLAGPEVILDDLEGPDVDRIILDYGRAPDGRYRHRDKDGRGRSVATQARFRQSVSRLFAHAVRQGWVQANPMERATIKPRVRGEQLREARTALPREQALALLRHSGEKPAGGAGGGAGSPAGSAAAGPTGRSPRADQSLQARDRALLYLLVSLGPRVSEVCRADRGHIYVEEGVTYWRVYGKGGKIRRLPVPPLVVGLLTEYLEHGRPSIPEDLGEDGRRDAQRALFLTWRGRRMAPRDVQNMLRRAVDRVPAGLRRDVTPHGLRHTAFTLLIAAGEDPTVVQRLAGHADLSTTGKYRDQLPGELERAMTHHPVLAAERAAPAPSKD